MVDLYIKDTIDFLWLLHKLGKVPEQSLLVTIAALKEALDKRPNQESKTWII